MEQSAGPRGWQVEQWAGTTKYEPFCDEVAAKFGRILVSLATNTVILFRRLKLVGLPTTVQY